jgi:hypothetical protein
VTFGREFEIYGAFVKKRKKKKRADDGIRTHDLLHGKQTL